MSQPKQKQSQKQAPGKGEKQQKKKEPTVEELDQILTQKCETLLELEREYRKPTEFQPLPEVNKIISSLSSEERDSFVLSTLPGLLAGGLRPVVSPYGVRRTRCSSCLAVVADDTTRSQDGNMYCQKCRPTPAQNDSGDSAYFTE